MTNQAGTSHIQMAFLLGASDAGGLVWIRYGGQTLGASSRPAKKCPTSEELQKLGPFVMQLWSASIKWPATRWRKYGAVHRQHYQIIPT